HARRGRGPPSRLRVCAQPRAGRAAPGPRLGRVGAGLAREDAPPPGLIVAVPGDGALEAVLERRARAPAEDPLGLAGRADVTVDLPGPLDDVVPELLRLA